MYFLLKQYKKEIHLLCNKNDKLPYDFDLWELTKYGNLERG